eukprot:CAMPEP_0196763286 /NCGR_PEP_ID=MMETSP1095-20130614/3749_1 /TAXON_ID=96789 ORGANISM="Chromulina nebulosa, Strain UTEXLB2642" /NCGR_SAMPLE_ID=MMETSP1095 /ASSEMBLY_ACC=CAM_ASM_000446 /LENGTH=669 /DNA_ID=CAMNT_0042116115 /DNA_START=287 /DNA_END=2296 /DNA_ORIENTATION=-
MEMLGCLGLSLSLVAARRHQYSEKQIIVNARLFNLFDNQLFSCIKSDKVGQLISLEGFIVKVSSIKPLVIRAAFQCSKCLSMQWVDFEDGVFSPPDICSTAKCRNKYLELQRSQVITVSYQRLKLQEITDSETDEVSARLPRTFEIEVQDDLVNCCRVGDIVTVVGIVKTIKTDVTRVSRGIVKDAGLHQLFVVAHSLTTNKKRARSNSNSESTVNSLEQLQMIRTIAIHPMCLSVLIASFCPSIYGHELVKLGLLLGLFGGSDSNQDRSFTVRLRSDIHVLIVGDPGLGKSQLLRFCHSVSSRSILVCGNTSTTAGLTVTLSKETGSNSTSVEAGALVLADKGSCCLDELDKMTSDFSALLEAMEQQTISIAKSGVVTSFHSRTTVLAAANPTGGHYNRRKTINENLKMPNSLLSRFDVIFILVDKPDESHDRRLSEHILLTHVNKTVDFNNKPSNLSKVGVYNNDENSAGTLNQRLIHQCMSIDRNNYLSVELMRNYIEYARKYVYPRMTKSAAKVLQKFFLTMRSQDMLGRNLPVTTRHLESLIRLSQARAKLELREEVTDRDAEEVIELLQESLIDAFTNDVGEIELGRRGGMSLSKQVKALVKTMQRESEIKGSSLFSKDDITSHIKRLKIDRDADSLIEVLRTECYLLKKGPKNYQLQSSSIL